MPSVKFLRLQPLTRFQSVPPTSLTWSREKMPTRHFRRSPKEILQIGGTKNADCPRRKKMTSVTWLSRVGEKLHRISKRSADFAFGCNQVLLAGDVPACSPWATPNTVAANALIEFRDADFDCWPTTVNAVAEDALTAGAGIRDPLFAGKRKLVVEQTEG